MISRSSRRAGATLLRANALKHMLDREDMEGLQALLAAGVDPDEVNDRGETALHWAVWRGRGAAIVAAGGEIEHNRQQVCEQLGEEYGAIFSAHLQMLRDPRLTLAVAESLTSPSGITSHFFGAIRIDAIRDVTEFKRDLDRELRTFKDSALAPGGERVYVAGEIEHENEIAFRREGIPILENVVDDLDGLAHELGIAPPARG